MLKTLLHKSGDEVKHYLRIKGKYDGRYFDTFILSTEINYFNTLSNEFYECLKSDLKEDYCNALPYKRGQYIAGDKVIYDGFLYTALEDTCEVPPCGWQKECKFKSDCFCELWECFLARILSCLVWQSSGLVEEDDTKNLAYKLKCFDDKVKSDIDAMLIYIRQYEGDCFDKLRKCLPCLPEDCDPCGNLPSDNCDYFGSVGVYNKYGNGL